MYEEFYEKIEENFKFEKSYPVKLKFQSIIITLEEFDTINSLIKIKDKEKKLEKKLNENKIYYLKVPQFQDVKKTIEKYIKFLNEMIKILNDKTKKEKRTMEIEISTTQNSGKKNELKNLSEKEIKEKIELLLKEGKYSFKILEDVYKFALKNKKVEK